MKVLAFLPMFISKSITGFIAWILYQTNSTSRKVTEINLKLCYPDLSNKDRDDLTRKSLNASGQLLAESAKIWLLPMQEVLQMASHVDGEDIINSLRKETGKGLLIISPHLGNWELLYIYLAYHFQSAGLYRPPKITALAPIILAGRKRGGGQTIKTTQMEVRKMLKVLKNAECLFLLPDQQPQKGGGVFAPFYGHQAYTMTLLQGLAQRTGAKIVMATCIRADGGFNLAFDHIDIDVSLSNELFAKQMNLALQQEIDKNPEQYEWAYKRFKLSPEGVVKRYMSMG